MTEDKIKFLTRTAVLLAVALVFQMGGLPQPLTGPLVNMVLYLAAILIGIWSGIFIGIFTPVIAFVRGILPPPLAPMIPFIALGNGVLVILFAIIKKKNIYLAIGIASLIKFLILASAVRFLVAVPDPVAQMMTFPQLLTALGGGVLALLVHKALKVGPLKEEEENEDKFE